MDNNKTNEIVDDKQTDVPDISNKSIDYKAEFEKQLAEYQKLKSVIDKTNSENADYKRKERERMTEDEKRQLAEKEKGDYIQKLEKQTRKYELEKTMLGKGFSEEETNVLIEKVDDPKSMVETMAEILKSRIDINAKQVKAQTLKTNTPMPEASTGTGFMSKLDELMAAKQKALIENNIPLYSKLEREIAAENKKSNK